MLFIKSKSPITKKE